ncbi:uncharacterized protein [Euphorbia lathyris]|uniref:uncharacterized protein isoform X2 n=1 Tax=Euphorbia lathyris TaxID=212925 RepID=UPI003313A5CF
MEIQKQIGMPNAFVTAPSTLKKKLNFFGRQLKSTTAQQGMIRSLEAKLCLSICTMFPQGFSIPIEDLVLDARALMSYEIRKDMIEARNIVDKVLDIIDGSQIRIRREKDECDNQYVKMQFDGSVEDLVRLIASRYKLVFVREIFMEQWSESNRYRNCYGLSLVLRKVSEHPINLDCPKLVLLQLQHQGNSQSFPVNFFEGMKGLRVLSLDVTSLPHSVNMLKNLRTLRAKVLKSEDMSAVGGLINLEFLSISTLSSTCIPKEMGQLRNLRLLDLRKMNLTYIPPGVLSRMVKLEELYLPLSFRKWGCSTKKGADDYEEWESREDDDCDDEERINASLSEIVSLSLNALQICVPNLSMLPKKSQVFKCVWQFKIFVTNNLQYQPFHKGSINELHLTGDACAIKESGICDLMSRTEGLNLTRVRNLKNVVTQLEDCDFPQLEKMIISECDELEYVVDTTEKRKLSEDYYLFWKLESLHLALLPNLKEILHGTSPEFKWFKNLKQINIRFCHELKYVLPLSIVGAFTRLKSIEILECNEIEGIFYENKENFPYGTYSFIEELDLHSLPKLVGFLVRKDDTVDGVHYDKAQLFTTNKIVSNSMDGSIGIFDGSVQSLSTNESTSTLNRSCIDDLELICPAPTSISTGKLQQSVAQQFDSYKQNKDMISYMEMYGALIPSTLADKWLQNLKRLKIAFCDAVKVVFLFEESDSTTRAFNSLKELELYGLRNLVHIWFHIPTKMIMFQNLQLLVLSECHNLYLLPTQVVKLLVQLRKVAISRCEKMEEIIVNEDEEKVETIIDMFVFPQLKVLELQRMPNLRIFYGGVCAMELPSLESLKFNECNKMKSFSYGPLSTPMLKRIQVNRSSYPLMGDLNATIKRAAENFR